MRIANIELPYGTCICGYEIQNEADYYAHMMTHSLSYYAGYIH